MTKYDIVLYPYDLTPIELNNCDAVNYLDNNRLLIVTADNKTFVTSLRYLVREEIS